MLFGHAFNRPFQLTRKPNVVLVCKSNIVKGGEIHFSEQSEKIARRAPKYFTQRQQNDPRIASLPSGNEFEAENEQLRHVAPRDPEIKFERRFLVGSPADEIVKCAAAEGADMIVMGTHGRTGVVRLLLGSVAEAILRHAQCPVLTIKTTH